jgi:hypothetical protein
MVISEPLENLKKHQGKITQKDQCHMALNGRKISNLIISQPQSLFEIFDHLLDPPSPRIILNHGDGGQMEIGTNQINGFLPLLPYDHDSDLSHFLDLAHEPSNEESFGLPINEQRDVPIGGTQRDQRAHLCLLPIDPEDRVGFEL